MGLHGQGNERGYAMAALLVSLAIMSVLMSVAMPVWRHQARREKEAELAFRGEQYARAIALYRTKNANNFPPSIDVLVQGKYLRKKYKDPMTKDGEFRIVPLGGQAGQQGTAPQQTPPRGGGRGSIPPVSQPPQVQQPPISGPTGAASGGIIGVASKSTETSIRLYRGQNRYDMWPFTFNVVNRPGGGGPGAGVPGVQGGQPQPGMGGRRGRGQPGSGPSGTPPRGSGSGAPANPSGRGMSQPTGRPPGG